MSTDPLVGKQVNNFIIQDRIGQGGMATVYLAYQPSINRQVALRKIITLNAVPSERDEFRLRFAQEAQVIASLEHVHILPVYDYGIFNNEIAYIAMRLLRGGTLADMLAAGPLEFERTAEIFSQLALGLSYAHRKGVIHRDLKPSNIMFDESGFAYLSDFGLAKIVENSLELTKSDMVVGTPAYMAPEQLRGEVLDFRSDIYSMGCILYHMLVGHAPFSASTTGIVSVIYQQLEKEPTPPRDLNPNVPLAVEQVVLRALSKNRDARYTTADEMAHALNQALGRETKPQAVADAKPAPSPMLEGEPTVVEAVSLPSTHQSSKPAALEDSPTMMASTDAVPRPKPRSRMAAGGLLVVAVVIVLVAAFAVMSQNGQATPSPTPREAAMLETSLAGSSVNTEIPTLPPTETEPTLAPSPTAANTQVPTLAPSPTTDNTVAPTLLPPTAVLAPADVPSLPPTATESVVGGSLASTQAVEASGNEDGQIAFVSDRDGNNEIYIANLDGTESRNLTNNPASDEYPTWSPDGTQIAFMSFRDDPDSPVVYIMDADGSNLHRLLEENHYSYFPAWSRDGTQIALTIYNDEGNAGISIVDADGTNLRPVNNLPQNVGIATWSPDGKMLAFMGDPSGNYEVYEINVDGTGLQNLTENPDDDGFPSWSPNSNQIAFRRAAPGGNPSIYVMDSAGGDVRMVTDEAQDGDFPAWSPDGKQIAFASYYNSSGGLAIYIINVDGTGVRRVTEDSSNNSHPAWRP